MSETSGITIVKCKHGYNVKSNGPSDAPGPEEDWALKIELAVEGASVTFDNTVPIVVEDMLGRKLNIHFNNDNNMITLIEDSADPGKQLTEVEIDENNGFWFVNVGVSMGEAAITQPGEEA